MLAFTEDQFSSQKEEFLSAFFHSSFFELKSWLDSYRF